MPALTVIYSRSHGIGSLLIRAASWWGAWSHVAIVDGDDVIEARAWQGVVRTPLDAHLQRASAHEVVQIECPNPQAVLSFARAQVGKPYDWGGVLAFPLREPLADESRWFCSELVEAALLAGGRARFREAPARVTPWQSYMVA